jgi:CheY-like chemotaxis protein
MDIKMPVLDGHSAAAMIKDCRPALPIVAQSAYALEHERKKYGDIFDDYITKPIKAEILLKIVAKYVAIYK